MSQGESALVLNMPASKSADLGDFLALRMQQGKISSTSLITTVFGDAITQHGGEIWLGSLIKLLSPLGMNERRVRTAVFRLVQDDWLQSVRRGRRSFYRFSESGQSYYERAAHRIYRDAAAHWDRKWTIVLPTFVADDQREALRKGLLWLGFGSLANGVYAMPSSDKLALDELIAQLGVGDSVLVLDAASGETTAASTLQRLVMERWNLGEIGDLYVGFLKNYQDASRLLQGDEGLGHPHYAHALLLLRILLIHDYRRVLLRDPALPAEMLPRGWGGFAAQALTADLYRRIAVESAGWIKDNLENEEGFLPGAAKEFHLRYRSA